MVVEYVMLNTESTHWVPSKWAAISSTLTAAGTGFAWVKRISYGVETEQKLVDYITSYNNNSGSPDKTQLFGTLGEYQVVSISALSEHKKNFLRTENMPMSVYPIG